MSVNYVARLSACIAKCMVNEIHIYIFYLLFHLVHLLVHLVVYTGSLGFIEQCGSNIKQYRISGELDLGLLDFVVVTIRRRLSLNGHYMSVVS